MALLPVVGRRPNPDDRGDVWKITNKCAAPDRSLVPGPVDEGNTELRISHGAVAIAAHTSIQQFSRI